MTRLGCRRRAGGQMDDQRCAFDVQKQCHGLACLHGRDRLIGGSGKRNDVAHKMYSNTTTLVGPLIVSEYGHKRGIFSVNVSNSDTIIRQDL